VERTFGDLILEADSVSIAGWDFSWLDGRATEQRPSWGYQRLLRERLAHVQTALDPQGYQDCFNAFVTDVYAAVPPDGLPVFADGLRAAKIHAAVTASVAHRARVDVAIGAGGLP
jgi:predicted dehydrogenase